MLFNDLKKTLNIFQPFHDLVTDDCAVHLLVVVGQKISESCDCCKIIGKVRRKDTLFSQDVERLGIGLRQSQLPLPDDEFGQNDAAIGKQVQIMKNRTAIDGVDREAFPAIRT